MRRALIAATAVLMAIPAVAAADPPHWAPAHGRRAKERHERYYEPRRISEHERVWRGGDGRYHCRRSDGTTGLVVGAAAGALIGHELAQGDRTLGTVLGAAGGGLLGRQIDRNNLRCH